MIGKMEYDKLKNYFLIPKIAMKEYEDITCHFNEVFEVVNISDFEILLEDMKHVTKNKILLDTKIDIDEVFKLIPEELLDIKKVTLKQKYYTVYPLSMI